MLLCIDIYSSIVCSTHSGSSYMWHMCTCWCGYGRKPNTSMISLPGRWQAGQLTITAYVYYMAKHFWWVMLKWYNAILWSNIPCHCIEHSYTNDRIMLHIEYQYIGTSGQIHNELQHPNTNQLKMVSQQGCQTNPVNIEDSTLMNIVKLKIARKVKIGEFHETEITQNWFFCFTTYKDPYMYHESIIHDFDMLITNHAHDPFYFRNSVVKIFCPPIWWWNSVQYWVDMVSTRLSSNPQYMLYLIRQ